MREPWASDPDELDDVYRVDRDGVRHADNLDRNGWASKGRGAANSEWLAKHNAEVDKTRGMTLEEFAEYLRNGRPES